MKRLREFLKRILPPPVRSFMREVKNILKAIGDSKKELKNQIEKLSKETASIKEKLDDQNKELKQLYLLFESANRENLRIFIESKEEREQLRKEYQTERQQLLAEYQDRIARYTKILENSEKKYAQIVELLNQMENSLCQTALDNRSLLENAHKTLDIKLSEQANELRVIKQKAEKAMRSASEAVWAEVFNNAIKNCSWLRDVSLSPGRWAVGYPYLYVMYRVLNEFRPKSILELGLGQSTTLINQYVRKFDGVSSITVEQDKSWIEFYCNATKLSKDFSIEHIKVKEVSFLDDDKCLVYDGLLDHLHGKKFDFISVDGPAHSRSDKYRRIDVINLIPEYLSDSFVIIIDDLDVPTCKASFELIIEKLQRCKIEHKVGMYHG
jgi:seryl-tRNA synthetase